jgi:hypothetical protein
MSIKKRLTYWVKLYYKRVKSKNIKYEFILYFKPFNGLLKIAKRY